MTPKVIILGGGVAGMSAAHELIERGFNVEVYEQQPKYVGGKARSVDVPHSAHGEVNGIPRKALPGEHGFRFFPGFYKHITDTMRRIPFKGNKNGVLDNLVPTDRVMMARFDKAPLITLVNFPKSFKDLGVLVNAIMHSDMGLSDSDKEAMADKIWQLMTSCKERRKEVYERMGWWEFTDADHHSEAYREYFVGGLTRTLVAAKPKEVSTKTGGDILLQLLFLMANPEAHADRVLNAPTNDAWLYPWRDYLKEKGVKYFHGHAVLSIESDVKNSKVTGVKVMSTDGEEKTVTGDYYISALPVEKMSDLLTDDLIAIDPMLESIKELADDVAWMTGIQFYLDEDVKMTHGHVMYTSTPWALTSISQLQFWDGFDISEYGDGKVKGVLSVDVSDWTTPGILFGKKAEDCTKEEIKQEVWAQLKKSLIDSDGECLLNDEMLLDWYLDRDIVFDDDESVENEFEAEGVVAVAEKKSVAAAARKVFKSFNEEPLLVNKANSWSLRPEAFTRVDNLYLASDYVRTYTDLATMEGANEAARRAVNNIIDKAGISAPYCKIWDLHEPNVLAILRWLDKRRYDKGMAWNKYVPKLFSVLHRMNYIKEKWLA
ncbi:FAD-dependent oxidoreductase [Limibacter armeniacum]|uniref:hydroxysqualene dehydroxylase n=1 Tax=Limibacter armeniacum TaxID=466084 RepID=UPI002FE571C0